MVSIRVSCQHCVNATSKCKSFVPFLNCWYPVSSVLNSVILLWLFVHPFALKLYHKCQLCCYCEEQTFILEMYFSFSRQPVESPIVPACGKPTSNSLTRLPGVRNHIPYSDHNYGKPLTPPDSCSPDHQEEAEGFTRCIWYKL